MDIVERETSKNDEHYVVPLVFYDLILMLSNNKKQFI